ncbi:hypothetical protein [Lumpy skin disease virus]|uniref:Uncharacterized protein n=4 Tax=Lumpy skin disease virus TaxID=59509 RepID=Q91MY1_LSDV|nr:LSDV026 hypothetical protein [Lumpy skin disease virus NI-2490]AOE47602.1 hypothetical protein [Lumpy skin disease virus]AAK84987.1 LSDV026 hypothetical protein [Lumpy skin disease virus NI-2490]UJQ44199.1 hypothetical protein LSDVP10_00128 [Lumpy skin disease virus]UJQ44348.1 hypothetical protein LSDVP30_00127 [Lumpy skin disease virus]UJQ44399.1 hypothetical protein LSDVP50_00026 [Lumpy skin disease virus]
MSIMCLSNKKKEEYILKYFLNNRCYDDLYSVNGGNVAVGNFLKSKSEELYFSFNLFLNDLDISKKKVGFYSLKEINVNIFYKLLLNEEFFTVIGSYLVKLKHGNAFFLNESTFSNSVVITACVKNKGISGLFIPDTTFLKINIDEGDFIMSGFLNGVNFLPQIGGESIYLVTILSPKELSITEKAFFYKKNNEETLNITSNIISIRRLKIIELVNKIIKLKKVMKKENNCYIPNNFVIYDTILNKNNNFLYSFKKKYKIDDDETLWEKITNLFLEIDKLLDYNIKHYQLINEYIINKVKYYY